MTTFSFFGVNLPFTWKFAWLRATVVNHLILLTTRLVGSASASQATALSCNITCYPKDWPNTIAPGINKVSPALVGLFDVGREGGHLSQGNHLKLKLHFSSALTFSSFPPLIVSDIGLTKFLISSCPWPHCGLLLLSCFSGRATGSAHHVPHDVSKLSKQKSLFQPVLLIYRIHFLGLG